MKTLFNISRNTEDHIIRIGIIVFWWVFWLLNVLDKFVSETTFLWVGKNRLSQFIEYFASIGIENPSVAKAFLVFVTIVQIIAFLFLTKALWHSFHSQKKRAHGSLFWGILASLFIFSFFAIGDQIFGDRVELLEHSIYWIAIIVSWFVYTRAEKGM